MSGKIMFLSEMVTGVASLLLMSYLVFGLRVWVDLADDGKVSAYPGTLYEPVVRLVTGSNEKECEDDCGIAFVTTQE